MIGATGATGGAGPRRDGSGGPGSTGRPGSTARGRGCARPSIVPREARRFQGRRAGVVSRFLASALDGVVVALVLAAAWLGVAVLRYLLDPTSFSFPTPSLLQLVVAADVVLVPYLTITWVTTGRTYGDAVLGVRVIGPRGDIGWLRASLRALACVVFPLGLFWAAVNRRNASAQDLLLRTAVLYDWEPGRSSGDAFADGALGDRTVVEDGLEAR